VVETDVTVRRCSCILLGPDIQCEQPGESELVMGCVNEHLDVDVLCARHKRLALNGELVCTLCAPLGVRQISHVLSEDGRRCLA
jgi:hypothetical protein